MFQNKLIFNKYKVKRFIELSDYCWVYQGVNVKNNEPVFFKFEKRNSRFNFLESEAYCLCNLKGFGLPKIISYGKTGLYNVLIEELLGNSLYNLWKFWKLKKKDKKLNLKNVCMVALQIINRLEYIHWKNYIHKDIKPQNFVNGRKDPHNIYIVDFGFSHKYRSSRTGKHIKYRNKNVVIGSMSFVSINANIGYEQSRRDDLEALGYMLIFLATDNLPWMGIEDLKINKRNKCLKIYNLKRAISVEKLCKGLPEELVQYMDYTRKLEFEEDPNYDYLRGLFWTILFKNQAKNDLHFFWIINRNKFMKEDKNLESLSNTFNKREGSKNRLYKQIKNALERKESQKKLVKENSLQLEHVNSLNFKYQHKSIKYTNNNKKKEVENYQFLGDNGQTNNIFLNSISEYKNKYICNFGDSSSDYNKNLIDKNRIAKSKIINSNKNTKDEIQAYNMYDKNILYDTSNYKNIISSQNKNHKFNNNSKLINNENNLINSKVYNKEYTFNGNNNQNKISKKESIDKNIFVKKINKYKILNEKEKEKEKEKIKYMNYSDTKKDYFNSIINNFYDSINQSENNNLNRNINLVDKNTLINIDRENTIGNNSIYNNFNNNPYFIFKNMTIPSLKQSQPKNFNDFKEFQINKSNLLFKNIDSYQIIPNKMKNHLNMEDSDFQISLKIDNYLIGRKDRESFGVELNTNKNYNKNKIIHNSPYKNINDIFLTNNSIVYRNIHSLNNNTINNDSKICFTQTDEPIKFVKEFNNKKSISKNIKNFTTEFNIKNI